ncbi:UNVERIFIED_CONTAM: hypothetical protein PYX00_006610 [Menopon gallinae]|uniref:Exportin-5 n=1 Tax=Menopon gallinae TaxID=328185 RepID=A0AAW2HXI0_9NEOP
MATPEMISDMAAELVRALEVTMNPMATQALRQEAYTAYEHFKECSPYAAQVGLYLVQSEWAKDYTAHFGLQLMEHCVKYRWNQLSQSQKLFIKENTMRLLMAGTQRELHIKDALSRIVVEMVKREWPQQWPTLLAELNVASVQGATQAEIVLLIFLRLCEDVALLQTLESTQRRKDLFQALNTNMTDIFSFLLHLVTMHVDLFKKSQNAEQAAAHSRVVQTGLTTLSSFVEWVNYLHLTAENNVLLVILCTLLEDENFQNNAVECLLQIVSRKGPAEERKFLLEWFDLKSLNFILNAASNVSKRSLNESNYLFIKKLTQVLTGFGSHFCSLWGKDDFAATPARSEHLDMFLNVMLSFSRHPSLTMVRCANTLWQSFFKHQLISRDPVFQKYIPQWVETTAPKIIRVFYPVSRVPTTDQDTAAVLDFDSEEEFYDFFLKTRTEILETFRKATDVAPYVTFIYVEKWFRSILQQSLETVGVNEQSFCNIQSPMYLQWDAMANLLDRVLSRLVHLESTVRPSTVSGLELLELCLNFNPIDPLILSVLLSCISALFVFLSMATAEQSVTILPRVLDKIFAASAFSFPGQTKENRSRTVQNVRRHAGALLVKIGQRYPLLLLPLFDQINHTVRTISKDPQISKMEQITLQEALLLICNHFNEYNKQSQFVADVIRSGTEVWFEMEPAFRSPADFMAFVGLDKPPVEPSSEDINGQNRSQIVFCTQLFYSVIIRSTWPEDPDRAARGGFVVGKTSAGNPVYRNPAAPHIIPVLPNILSLIKVLNSLWTPDSLSRLSQGYKAAHQMLEMEKANLLGLNNPSASHLDPDGGKAKVHSPLERMQIFLQTVHENCYHILGNAGPSLGKDFYQIPQLANALITVIFNNLEFVPDYRIRPIIRTFFKNFISACPKVHYEDVLLPVLSIFLPYMLTRLTKRWEYITQMKTETNTDEENSDAQEIVEEKLNSLITREYTDVLKICLVGGCNDPNQDCEVMDQDEMAEPSTAHRAVNQFFTEAVSELGVILIRTDNTCQVIVLTLLRLLTWQDSSSCIKSAGLLYSVVRHLSADDALNEHIVAHIMTTVLQALQIHGEYESIQGILLTLGAQLYEMLRPKYTCLLKILMQIPNVNQQDIQKFDEKIMNMSQNHKTSNKLDKTTRDLFRKITHSLIGRTISQLFKKEVKIVDLPKMEMPKKVKWDVDNLGNDYCISNLLSAGN